MRITDFNVAIIDGDTHLSKWIVEHGRLNIAEGFYRDLKKYIPQGAVVVDAGACLGDHTITLSQMVGPSGIVHAFEPNPPSYECLVHNMKDRANVRTYPVGLADRAAFADSIGSGGQFGNLGANQIAFSETGSISVDTLDNIAAEWHRFDFMKVDVEGFESLLFSGARETLKKFRPAIAFELNRPVLADRGFSEEDVFGVLRELKYSFRSLDPAYDLATTPMIDVLATC